MRVIPKFDLVVGEGEEAETCARGRAAITTEATAPGSGDNILFIVSSDPQLPRALGMAESATPKLKKQGSER